MDMITGLKYELEPKMDQQRSFDFSFALIFRFQTGIMLIFQYFLAPPYSSLCDEPAIQGHCMEDEQIQELK